MNNYDFLGGFGAGRGGSPDPGASVASSGIHYFSSTAIGYTLLSSTLAHLVPSELSRSMTQRTPAIVLATAAAPMAAVTAVGPAICANAGYCSLLAALAAKLLIVSLPDCSDRGLNFFVFTPTMTRTPR